MANVNLKTNFADGEKLFAQQLNNNFKTIQEGMNNANKIIWQDGTDVSFKRYLTNDVEELPILDGAVIYDVEKGRHYIDYQGTRIQVGSSGKEVVIQEEQPTEEDNKIWIDPSNVNTLGTEVIDSLEGDEHSLAPSVDAVKKFVNNELLKKHNEIAGMIDNTMVHLSYDECVIGTWFGKPLYRKVVSMGALPNATLKSTAHGVSNLDFVTKLTGMAYSPSSKSRVTLPYADPKSEYTVMIYANDDNIVLSSIYDQSAFTESYAIMEYTKTTDSEVI